MTVGTSSKWEKVFFKLDSSGSIMDLHDDVVASSFPHFDELIDSVSKREISTICIFLIFPKRTKNSPLLGPNPVLFRQSNALDKAAAWTALDSVKPRIPIVDLAIFIRVLRLVADAIPVLPPIDAPVPLENPVESDGLGPLVVTKSPPSTVKTLAIAKDVAEITAAAEAAALFDPAEAGRSTVSPGDCTGGMDACFDLRFLGSFSLRNFGGCWAPALQNNKKRLWLFDVYLRNVCN